MGVPCVTAAQLNRGAVGVDGDNEDDFDEEYGGGVGQEFYIMRAICFING